LLPSGSNGGAPDEASRVSQELSDRARIESKLRASAGLQLAIVRYAPEHVVSAEWVYNGADLDHAKVIWAREIPGVDIRPLLDYYSDRQVWLIEADAIPPEPVPYPVPTNSAATPAVPTH
jgi:hypothetical protein